MNITYVYYTDHDQHSAHNNQIIHTCNAIYNAGHNVTLVTAGGIEAYADEHNLTIDFTVRNTYSIDFHPTFKQIIYYVSTLRAARSSDVIFTRDISFLKFLTLIPNSLTPPVVFEAHKSHAVVDNMDQREEKRRLNQADGILTISDGIRADLESLDVSIDAVVWDAASTEYVPSMSRQELRSELDIAQDAVVFVYAGSLDPQKYDLRSVLDAFKSFDSAKQAHLYILGGTQSNIEQLREYTTAIGADDSVRFLGHVPQKLVFRYLKAADVGIVAQQPTDVRASKYTSPLKLFEYLVCGLVVVATDVPSIREVADEEQRILTYDPNDLIDIQTVLETAVAEHDHLATGNLTERYSYEHRAEELLAVLKRYSE